MPIVTKEQLKSHIHSIHDYIRNSGAGYGMQAMKLFMFFYGLKIIEPKKKELKIENMTQFSQLVELANSTETIIQRKIIKELKYDIGDEHTGILYDINESKLKGTLLSTIPPLELPIEFYVKIINLINEIPINNKKNTNNIYDVDLSGKLYEYFIGRDQTAISELGAYFSDRHITNYCINEVNPELENNNLPLYIDPFGGSGGFTLPFVKYINDNFNVDSKWWKNNHLNIHHCDMNKDVIEISSLEILCLTGELPEIKNNFKKVNSFKEEYAGLKFKYIMSNPPYGGDSNKGSVMINDYNDLLDDMKNEYYVYDENKNRFYWSEKWAKEQYDEELKKLKEHMYDLETRKVNFNTSSQRIKDFVKSYDKYINNDIKLTVEEKKQYKLIKHMKKGQWDTYLNDKESVSLILFMDLLDEGGTCSVILKEGVFFNNKYSSIRKCLVDKYNVYKIVSIESDQFENTTTKTSILFFKNNGRTQKVQFSKLDVIKEEKTVFETKTVNGRKQRIRIKSKDNIIKVNEIPLTTATYAEISAPTITKNKKGEDIKKYHYSLNAKKYMKVDVKCSDKYEMVALSDEKYFTYGKKSKHKAKGEHIKDDGKYNFYTSSTTIKKSDYNDYDTPHIMIGTGGNSCLHMDSNFSCSSDMILLKPSIDITYVYNVLKISWDRLMYEMNGSTINHVTKSMLDTFQIPIPRSTTKLNYWVKKISTPYNTIQQKQQELVTLEEKVKLEVKRIGEEERCDMVALGELCDIETGEYVKKINFITGDIPVYGGGNISKYINRKNRNNSIVVSKDGITKNCVQYIFGDFFLNHHGWTLKYKKNNYVYINIWLLNNQHIIYNIADGSVQKGINQEQFYGLKIPIPRNTVLIQNLETDFKQIETLHQEIKDAESEYKRVLQELADDIKPSTIQEAKTLESKVVIKDGSDTEIQDIEVKENNSDTEQPRKKKKKKKHKKTLNIMENAKDEQKICVVGKKKRTKKVVKRDN